MSRLWPARGSTLARPLGLPRSAPRPGDHAAELGPLDYRHSQHSDEIANQLSRLDNVLHAVDFSLPLPIPRSLG